MCKMSCGNDVLVKVSVKTAKSRVLPRNTPNCPSVVDQFAAFDVPNAIQSETLVNNPKLFATDNISSTRNVVLIKTQAASNPTGIIHQPISRAFLPGATGFE